MDSEYVVNVQGLNKSFNGKPAVIDLTLKIKRGEIFGFLGPNGSGKTTTIRMLCGLMTPDSGNGTCLGFNILEGSPMIKRLVGYVPQTFSLYQDLTVTENLKFISKLYGDRDYRQRVVTIMQDLDLMPYQNSLAGNLSGGWKQRLSLAAALIHEPKLLLLDEPTAGVDPKARRDFWDYISLLKTQGITSLVSTHYMDEAERCNRLAYIINGRLLIEGTVSEIIQKVGIHTFAATGDELAHFAKILQANQEVEQVVVWGNVLRISDSNAEKLTAVIAKYPQYQWQRIPASLEEVFIHLVGEKRGNTYA